MFRVHAMFSSIFLVVFPILASAQDTASLLLQIKAVGKEGAGNVEAAKAWKELVAKGPAVMPDVLAGMNDAGPVAVNWLRAAVEAIQDKAMQKGDAIPAAKIEAFLNDKKHDGRARRLAYECLVRLDATTPERLLPKMLDDPASELRRDAVAVKLKTGLALSFDSIEIQKKYFRDLLGHARDRDQVNALAEKMKELGEPINLVKHFGFVTRWQLIGPFDNSKGVGFHTVYPPEKGFDVKGAYPGKGDEKVQWREYTADKGLGMVDFNEIIGKLKGTIAYGYTALDSKVEREIEVRAGSNNAVRMWLNGKEVYFREEYHHGMEMDQHVGKGVLKVGRNEILIKVCQNEQTEKWAELWSFQLRVCDPLGAAVSVSEAKW